MRRLILALALGLGVALVACSGDEPPTAAAGFDTRTIEAGEVTVAITPTRVDSATATFEIAFDTHSVDLDFDVAGGAALTVDGATWTNATWEGDGPGGHHRSGTLTFTSAGEPAGEATVTIDGLPDPVTTTWTLPEGS